MSKLTLSFSDFEMRTFLSMKGYKFTEVDCWDSHNMYHNDVEYTDHKVQIAHKDIRLVKELTDEHIRKAQDYSIDNVFRKEMQLCLLKL